MAEIARNTCNGSYGSQYTQILSIAVNSQSIANNASNVTITYTNQNTMYNDANYGYANPATLSITDAERTQTYNQANSTTDYRNKVVVTLASWTGDVKHNSDGTLTLSVSASFSSNSSSLSGGSVSGTYTLPTIPRYVNITSFSVSKRDETSVTFNWTADANCDYAWYSKDGGNSWAVLDGNTGIVSDLSANTSYNFKLRLRRTDSQLTTDSSTYSQTTYDYPKPTSVNDFTIGEGATVYLYNPLGRNCTLQLISNVDGSVIGTYSGTYQGNVNAEFKTEDAINKQYASIPNSKSGTYYAKVTYGSSVKTLGTGTYSINTSQCYPTFSKFDYEDINQNTLNLTENNKVLVNNYSECQFKITIENKAVAKNGATIKYYYCTWGSKSVSANESSGNDVTVTISDGVGGTLKVIAVDSRGLQSQTDTTIIAPNIAYTEPIISNLETQRKDGVDIETYIACKIEMFNGKWNDNNENSLLKVQYRAKTGNEDYGEWGDITDIILSKTPYSYNNTKTYTLSVNDKVLIHANGTSGGFVVGTSYTLQIMVQDGYNTYFVTTKYATTDVTDGKVGLSRYKDSNGDYHYGIGCMPDKNYNLKIQGNTNVEGELHIGGIKITPKIEVVVNTEIATNEYIDGKIVYIKQLEFTDGITGSEQFTKAHGITGASKIWIDTANSYFINDVNRSIPVPCNMFENNFNDRIGIEVTSTSINIFTDTTWWDWWTKVIRLKYVK